MRDNTEDFRSLFLNDVPLMDVRAPVEFDKGAFPQSVNLPLMVDVERQKVGTMYKQQGQQAGWGGAGAPPWMEAALLVLHRRLGPGVELLLRR